jgi:hypothetical protein
VARRTRAENNEGRRQVGGLDAAHPAIHSPRRSARKKRREERRCSCRPSEYSAVLLAAARFRPSASSRTWLLVQSSSPVRVARLLVPHFHLAVGHFLGCVAFPGRAAPLTVKRAVRPLFEFRCPPESCPTRPSRPVATSQLLSWAFAPYSTHGIGGPLTRALPARYVPSSGFGYPRDGLRPPSPCRFCFTPAALLGFTLRSFLLSEGIRCVSAAEGPTYRFTRRFSRRRSGGPAPRAAVPGL